MTKKMNGKIEVESQNEHTIFRLIFPFATAENVAQKNMKEN